MEEKRERKLLANVALFLNVDGHLSLNDDLMSILGGALH